MEEPDFIVVGGGLYGAALTYELVERGSSVVLLEGGRLAERASGGPGKRGVRATLRNSRELPFIREALELWPHLSDRLGADCGFERLGGLTLISPMPEVGEIGLAQARAHEELQRAHGIDTRFLGSEELQNVQPGINADELGALHCPDEGIASQKLTTQAYAAAARRAGAAVLEQSMVEEVGSGPRPWAQVRGGRRLHARRAVILAANYGTNALLERSGQKPLPLWTMVPQVLMYRAKENYQPKHLIGHLQQKLAIKPLADGITMISGGMRGKWDAGEESGTTVSRMIETSLNIATTALPALAGGELLEAHASLPETYTPDGLPYIDYIDSDSQVFVAAGWHGHGFAIAPSMASHIADWLSTGRKPSVLNPFRVPGR
ncbi:FAD-binding oxidoreductase [Nocardioides sp. NPDC127503]|uniref:NAD(P)/FAD-dependent oxidoreductase n=1 Tax=Nocardioides sp. NPDC127503 TaxID=3154516 RepID=UPI003327181E